MDIRKVGGSRPRFVTEERLEQRLEVFSKDIKNEMKVEMGKLSSSISQQLKSYNGRRETANPSWMDMTCNKCQQKGHTARFCPQNNETDSVKKGKTNSKLPFQSNGQGEESN